MKTALITGANKGIGFETAKQLAVRGYFVFLGSRDLAKGKEAKEKLIALGLAHVEVVELDVTRAESIAGAKKALEAQVESLDVLINNAGILGKIPQPASRVPVETMRAVFETNFFGAIQVTQQFLELLSKAAEPRIVNVTSDLASLTNHNDPAWRFYPFKSSAYGPSKTALNAYTVMLAYEMRNTHFKINCVNPGHTATDFNNFRGEKPVSDGASIIVKYATLDRDGVTGKYLGEEGVIPW